ncbi:hypothetical protein PPERSA_05846 [Pseudocohnilembus persalinus]|uniref:Uncharacterized protein n=1 Tax=Pseudocohnilembus persalinus TaxID=266149 RepID=A0A0V0R3V6_PSEPJ|nr:hypothetical protein PPERSA_05846 [Pseudocohnilembus persalinus]|eukprot:KRX09177.1 hypothetical protein PPERSA_05846 [Pseudocohnilembus persalinus]
MNLNLKQKLKKNQPIQLQSIDLLSANSYSQQQKGKILISPQNNTDNWNNIDLKDSCQKYQNNEKKNQENIGFSSILNSNYRNSNSEFNLLKQSQKQSIIFSDINTKKKESQKSYNLVLKQIEQQRIKQEQNDQSNINLEVNPQQIQQDKQEFNLLKKEKDQLKSNYIKFADTNYIQGRLADVYKNMLTGQLKRHEFDKLLQLYLNKGNQYGGNYIKEEQFNKGDVILKFPNPESQKHKAETFQRAPYFDLINLQSFFQKIIKSDALQQQQLVFNPLLFLKICYISSDNDVEEISIFYHSFQQAFIQLDNYYTDAEKAEIQQLKKSIKNIEAYILTNKTKKDNKASQALVQQKKKLLKLENNNKKKTTGGQFFSYQFNEQKYEELKDDLVAIRKKQYLDNILTENNQDSHLVSK